MVETKKTTIELPDEQYFYLQEKALELKKKGISNASMTSIIRELIERDMQAAKKQGGKRQ